MGPTHITLTTKLGEQREEVFSDGWYEFHDFPSSQTKVKAEIHVGGWALTKERNWPTKAGKNVWNINFEL